MRVPDPFPQLSGLPFHTDGKLCIIGAGPDLGNRFRDHQFFFHIISGFLRIPGIQESGHKCPLGIIARHPDPVKYTSTVIYLLACRVDLDKIRGPGSGKLLYLSMVGIDRDPLGQFAGSVILGIQLTGLHAGKRALHLWIDRTERFSQGGVCLPFAVHPGIQYFCIFCDAGGDAVHPCLERGPCFFQFRKPFGKLPRSVCYLDAKILPGHIHAGIQPVFRSRETFPDPAFRF